MRDWHQLSKRSPHAFHDRIVSVLLHMTLCLLRREAHAMLDLAEQTRSLGVSQNYSHTLVFALQKPLSLVNASSSH